MSGAVLHREINNEIEAKMLAAGLVSVDRSRLCGTATSYSGSDFGKILVPVLQH
jgi:hypothetical protein